MKDADLKKADKKIVYFAIRWSLILGAVAAWEISARLNLYNTFFTSYPSVILKDLMEFAASGKLARHTFITLQEAFLGLFYGTSAGILTGVVFAQFDPLGKIFNPILTALNAIPQLTLAPVYVLWFGLGIASKVFLSGLMVFFILFFSTYSAIKNTEQNLIESAHLLGDNSFQTLWHVVIPACMPFIFSGIRGGVGACMVGAIIGEYMGSSGGFGWMVSYATSYFKIERVMSCIIILLIVGVLLDYCLERIERFILRWRSETQLSLS
ncbi:MAG: ABC transporter permease [Desulfobacter sp.]|nr:MAG: ABC transporter permease [Desulfobacter sp.]